MSKIRRTAFAATFAAALVVGAGAASAGEVTGNGKALTNHANSECRFSGLEDYDGLDADGDGRVDVTPGTVQNWGQATNAERVFLRSIGVSPSTLCNGHLNPIK